MNMNVAVRAHTWQTVTSLIIARSHIKDIMVEWKRICLQLCYLDQEAEISLQAEAFWLGLDLFWQIYRIPWNAVYI